MSDLKQCPFCGSEAQLLIVPGRVAHWVVICSKGCCNTCQYISDHDAEEAWNKRTTEEIVRCKDCKYYVTQGEFCKYDSVWEENKRHPYGIGCKPDWFCADGKRR